MQLFKNNAFSVLAAGLTSGATSLSVQAGHGDRFPVVAGADWTMLTLTDASKNIEVVKVISRAGGSDAMTVVRAQEGTTARSWLAGDIVSLRLTAGALTQLQSELLALGNEVPAHEAAADPHPQYLTATEGVAAFQPVNPRLTTLSGLTTQQAADLAALSAFGGTLLNGANAAAARQTLDTVFSSRAEKTAAYTVVASDCGQIIEATAGTWTLSLTAAATLGATFVVAVKNSGTGVITIDPNEAEQIDGGSSLNLVEGESVILYCSGAAWFTFGKTASAAAVDVQTFTASGTWTKPVKGSIAVIEGWGGGGSGGRGYTNPACGGGGGGGLYVRRIVRLSDLGAAESVTIGAGGASKTANNANGNNGGNTTFGAHLTAYGGGGGTASGASTDGYSPGGGGGGKASYTHVDVVDIYGKYSASKFGGDGGTPNAAAPRYADGIGHAFAGGGGGGWDQITSAEKAKGGDSIFGGAGGGGGSQHSYLSSGGTSVFGGNGGAGGKSGLAATDGQQPGGGGGGSFLQNSGAGGDGMCRVTVF